MFITVLLCMFIFLIYYYYVHYGRTGRLINLIPGPLGAPIAGNAFQLYTSTKEQWKLKCNLSDKYYPIFKIWIFFTYGVSIRHPDDLKTILNSSKYTEKCHLYNFFRPWLGTGLFTSKGAKWYARRKILTPAFHYNIMNQFADILIKEGNSMTKSLKDVGEIVVKDLIPFVSEHTLNAVCETTMGISLQKEDESQQYRNAVHDIIELIFYRGFKPWFYNDFLFSLSPQGRKQKKILKILHGFTEKVIAKRKLYHERTNHRYLKNLENTKDMEIDDVEVFEIKKKQLAMLDLLIALSRDNFLTDLDIREEIDTFMVGGHDTTAMGITFALLLLAEHKDVQERVRVEVDSVMQENRGRLTMRSLQTLSYLERCLKESLRLYPVAPFILRNVQEDVKLDSYVVPAGTILQLDIFGVHRDPNFWPNPEIFDPDRFLPENMKNHHPYSYLPFSAGPRNCIGQRFGMLIMKVLIASLVHNFYLEPIDCLKDIQLKFDMMIQPSQPVHIKFIPISSE
ncbi:cytochrome P450 4C1-like [Cataglyphis hispanica]|uniref:cytochrome P450 4C1-like n=1 Tax=Cataglyphis hispanica TaxID=1086592 RepID=UPI0021805AA5|nr:cytochrome P450 4C1-like [Cataglyphis hispanica]XP_050453658.1 cytochrome P450 4C1-like [Cataglyphis hispanica]XP_050453659.1 cytochrome P450 4C1-like [Cataglyphis hispanica]XP_050453660.1 cytochrome P450 4C1-like [Cataglyphis hispanica]XP_050453661.1 cytochrome P450 4C1-like [Cataglyphis hispanica]